VRTSLWRVLRVRSRLRSESREFLLTMDVDFRIDRAQERLESKSVERPKDEPRIEGLRPFYLALPYC